MDDTRFIDLGYSLGYNVSFSKTLASSFLEALEYGMETYQFCMGNMHTYSRTRISQEDILLVQALNSRYPMHVFSHAPYTFNLNGSKDHLAWNGNAQQDYKTKKVITELEYELRMLSNFSKRSNGVVVHPGNYPDRYKGLRTIATTINKIDFPKGSKLLLENSAGQGTSLACTFTEIKQIIDNIYKDKLQYIGVCLDTCHIYAYGTYDLSQVEEIDRMFDEFDATIGLERLALIHFNDSDKKKGSRADRHAHPGFGYIWKDHKPSLIYFIKKCKKLNIPMVIEVSAIDMGYFIDL